MRRRRGAAAVEYALLLMLIGVTLLGIIAAVGGSVRDVFTHVGNEIRGDVPGDPPGDGGGGGPTDPSIGDGGGGPYTLTFLTDWSDYSGCSDTAQSTRSFRCDGAAGAADAGLCQDRLPDGTSFVSGHATGIASRSDAWYGDCPLKWRYHFQGPYGRYGPTSGAVENLMCWPGAGGYPTSRMYFPARCYAVLPDGSQQLTENYADRGLGDSACVDRGMVDPGPDLSSASLMGCGMSYGSGSGDGQWNGGHSRCTGNVIATMPMPYYGATNSDDAKAFCRANHAVCCGWVADPDEAAPDQHQRYWTVTATDAEEVVPSGDQSSFAWWAYPNYSEFPGYFERDVP